MGRCSFATIYNQGFSFGIYAYENSFFNSLGRKQTCIVTVITFKSEKIFVAELITNLNTTLSEVLYLPFY